LPPEECTVERATSFHPKSHSAVISKSNFTGTILQDFALKIPDLPRDLYELTTSANCFLEPSATYGLSRSNEMDLHNKTGQSDFWSQSVGKIFFESYGLNSKIICPCKVTLNGKRSGNNPGSESYMAPEVLQTDYYCKSKKFINNGDQENGIELAEIDYDGKCKNDAISPISTTSKRYYPFPIINASVEILPSSKNPSPSTSDGPPNLRKIAFDDKVHGMTYLPVEFTPLYYGISPRQSIRSCTSQGKIFIMSILLQNLILV
jgi:hypothetical protein